MYVPLCVYIYIRICVCRFWLLRASCAAVVWVLQFQQVCTCMHTCMRTQIQMYIYIYIYIY